MRAKKPIRSRVKTVRNGGKEKITKQKGKKKDKEIEEKKEKEEKFDGLTLVMDFVEFPKKGETYKKKSRMMKNSTGLSIHDWRKVEIFNLQFFYQV